MSQVERPATREPESSSPPRDRAAAGRDWESVRQWPEFRDLIQAKRRFILPATVFFLVWYLLLPLGNGLAPGLMKTKVIGNVNLAYVFALSEFVMTWLITYLYIHRANTVFDRLVGLVRGRMDGQGTGGEVRR